MENNTISNRNGIKVFVATTVYGVQNDLDRIYSMLDGFGYDVMMSHKGTFLVDSNLSNQDNCVNAVKQCDVFVGFVRPEYGSGVVGEESEKSITHLEFEAAYARGIPHFVLADYRVTFARQFINKNNFDIVTINSTKPVDRRSVELYNMAILNDTQVERRKGNWVQEFKSFDDQRLFLEAQFKDVEQIKRLIEK